jgi:hypothetical protein
MTDMIAVGQTEIFASPPGTEHNTFTIIGRCERTGMLGICTTTRSLSVGSRVTHGRARVGVMGPAARSSGASLRRPGAPPRRPSRSATTSACCGRDRPCRHQRMPAA